MASTRYLRARMGVMPMDGIVMDVALSPGAAMPYRAHEGDAGLDLACKLPVVVPAGCVKMAHTGVSAAVPDGCFGLLVVRSSIGAKRCVMLATGASIIDSGYRGEIGVPLCNFGHQAQRFEAGERIAQLVIVPYEPVVPRAVASLDGSERGAGGFGSSGRS